MIEAHLSPVGLIFQGGDADAVYTLKAGDGLKGWLIGVGSRFTREDRPTAIGQHIGRRLLGAREITLQGSIHAKTPQEMDERILALNAGTDGEPMRLLVKQPKMTTFATVYRDGEPSVDIVAWPTRARYQLTLFAPDPRRLGEEEHRPLAVSSAVLVNRGNYEASPRFRVRGDRPGGYTITDGARQFTVLRPLQPGIPHDVDMVDGSLRIGGSRVIRGVGRADLITIPANLPGQPSPGQITVTADGALIEPRWRDTWM